MENTEIRIGNYIKRNGLVVQVDEQTFWDMKNNPNEYEPITLSSYWLTERFNFKINFGDDDDEPYYYNKNKDIYLFLSYDKEYYKYNSSKLRYVHQLQNLLYVMEY